MRTCNDELPARRLAGSTPSKSSSLPTVLLVACAGTSQTAFTAYSEAAQDLACDGRGTDFNGRSARDTSSNVTCYAFGGPNPGGAQRSGAGGRLIDTDTRASNGVTVSRTETGGVV